VRDRNIYIYWCVLTNGQNLEAQGLVFRNHDPQSLSELLARADDNLVVLIIHPGELNRGEVGKDGQGLFHEVGVGQARGGDRQTADLAVERKLQRSQRVGGHCGRCLSLLCFVFCVIFEFTPSVFFKPSFLTPAVRANNDDVMHSVHCSGLFTNIYIIHLFIYG
jgi:hypothetical protein